jgi:serine/threonine protein kinase
MIGKTVSHYRIVGPLGSGGMGVVYSGEDVRLGRPVALKFVPEDLARDRQAVERLKSEARTASGLNHTNICTIFDIGDYEGQPFIVMELLKGQTLRDKLTAAPLKTLDVVELGIQVADALDSAHRQNIIHRDIKPANIFLVDRGPVKVLDFGLAKFVSSQATSATTAGSTREQTAEGVTLGTVSYMSPEQVTGEELDGRSDLFSLGVVLYEALTGHQPFTGKTSAVVFSAILTQAPVAPVVLNPTLPLRLQEVINNCLEKDRELRYQDAAGLRAELRRVKRDLESGRSGVFGVTEAATVRLDPSRGGPARTTIPPPDSAPVKQTTGTNSKAVYAALAAIVAIAALAAAMYFRTLPREQTTSESVAPSASPAFIRTQLALAAASIESKDYRAALMYADEVLRVAPEDKDAARIRDAARAMLARFDDAIDRANRRLAAGDTDGATSALNAARAIDPAATAVSQLSAGIAGILQAGERARRDAPPPKATATAQQPVANVPPPPVAGRTKPADQPPAAAAPTPAPVAPPVAPEPEPSRASASARETPEPRDVPAAAPPNARVASPPPATPAPPAIAPSPASPVSLPRPESSERRESAAGSASPESDDAVIRRVVATYARAIETKDLALFRSVKPNLTPDEQRRIEQGFRAVASQQVSMTIISIEPRGSDALVRVRRRDTIQAGGRQQITESLQTLTLTRTVSGWVIREIR